VPGPLQVTDPPSPIDHTENEGVAVIVNDTPAADTMTDFGTHADAGVHAHNGKPTY